MNNWMEYEVEVKENGKKTIVKVFSPNQRDAHTLAAKDVFGEKIPAGVITNFIEPVKGSRIWK